MNDTVILELAQEGVLTLPKALRNRYQLQPGDTLTLLDLGGVFVITLRRSEIDTVAGRLKDELSRQSETLEGVLAALREQRDTGTF